MIVWLFVLAIVLAASFLLALRSMRDYQEIPGEDEGYSLFLIRKPQEINVEILKQLHDSFLKSGQMLSFERLFKGNKSALVIYGPRSLTSVLRMLDLLELEDYTEVSPEQVLAWEMGVRKGQAVFEGFPQLRESEHFWWQVLLSRSFKPQIRAVVVSLDAQRRQEVSSLIENIAPDQLVRLPKGFSNAELLDFYQKRSFKKDNGNPHLSPEEVLKLIKI